MQYKIELKYFYGWDDAGWTEEMAGEMKPLRFKTIRQAQAALEKCFAGVKAAVVAHNMDTEEVRDDYRIVVSNDGD